MTLRGQAQIEASELAERYNDVYLAFLIDELKKQYQQKLAEEPQK